VDVGRVGSAAFRQSLENWWGADRERQDYPINPLELIQSSFVVVSITQVRLSFCVQPLQSLSDPGGLAECHDVGAAQRQSWRKFASARFCVLADRCLLTTCASGISDGP
jgi:hypothetical protein